MLKRIFAVLGAVALLLALSGCSDINYAGEGNDFVVTGTVKEVQMTGFLWDDGVHRVLLDPATSETKEASGEATDWFSHEDSFFHPIQDSFTFYNCYREPDGWDTPTRFVGEVRSATGRPMNLTDLAPGTRVKISGKIHASKSSKSSPYRAVFHLIQVTSK